MFTLITKHAFLLISFVFFHSNIMLMLGFFTKKIFEVNAMKIIHTFMPTRDGVNLATDVYLPDLAGEYPLIIIRSPYYSAPWKPVQEGQDFCRKGVGMLIQDCRGTG